MMPGVFSPLAQRVDHPRDVTDRANPTPWGVCVHTTGGGVLTLAKRLGVRPMEAAIGLYMQPDDPKAGRFTNFPHYVLDTDGSIAQIAGENERARHCGISADDRAAYLSGSWRRGVGAKPLALWDKRWAKKSPLSLFPSKSPNEDFLGVEMIPLPTPRSDGLLFTDEQHLRLAALLDDIEDRYPGLDLDKSSRLVGHEDIEPLARWTSKAGWDPGSLSAQPRFDWARTRPLARVASVLG